MIKVIALGKRKPGVSQEEFSRHLREVHAPIAQKYMSQLRIKRYIQNHVMSQLGAMEPEFPGITEVWYENMEEFNTGMKFWTSEAGKVIRDDEDRFIDRSTMKFIIVEENIVF